MGCMVIPGIYGILVQCLLFLVSIGALLAKWLVECQREKHHARSFWVFCLDGSKQLAGAAWLHVTNLSFATILAFFVGKGDQCEWYWINIMIDTTLGCVVQWIVLKAVNSLFITWLGKEKARDWTTSGHYYVNGEFQWVMFAKQAFIWVVVVVTLMKIVMVTIMVSFHNSFLLIASTVLEPFLHDDRMKLLVVMILTPSIMNAFQFCVVDSIIKLNAKLKAQMAAEEPLLQDNDNNNNNVR